MNDPVTELQQLGFSDYEAKAYVALVQRSPLNGSELARASGIPRANIYAVLRKLEERGAVLRLDTPEGTRYTPVLPRELFQRLEDRYLSLLEAAGRAFDQLPSPGEHDYVWNTQSYPALLDHAHTIIDGAQEKLQVAIWRQEARALAGNVAAAEARGVEITTLCLASCATECGGCRGRIYRYDEVAEPQIRWLVLVPDESEMVASEIGPGEAARTVRTRHRLLVELASCYIAQGIALTATLNELARHLDQQVMPEIGAVLAAAGLRTSEGRRLMRGRWLAGGPES